MQNPYPATDIESPTMSTPGQPSSSSSVGTSKPVLFTPPANEPSGRGKVVFALAAVTLLAFIAGLLATRSHKASTASPNAIVPVDIYAKNLSFTQLAMSQSTSLSGGTSTFIDGHVSNAGPDTLTGITMQVLFRNDVALPPQVETLPLTLIRTHEPYVDTEPVSAAPLKSGDEAEFRLIFETVTGSWNQQMPDLHVIHVAKR